MFIRSFTISKSLIIKFKCGPNKKLIRSLSMVLRMNFSDNEERLKNV
jgi:hypothetical protein